MLPSGSEILIILLFVLLFFGTKDLPKVVRTMGKWTAVFRRSMYEVRSELNKLAIEDELKSREIPKDTVKRDNAAETEAAENAYRKPSESVENNDKKVDSNPYDIAASKNETDVTEQENDTQKKDEESTEPSSSNVSENDPDKEKSA